MLRIVIAITVYLVTMNLLVFFLSDRRINIPAGFELVQVFVLYSVFLLMPVRWVLMLVQIVRSLRARPAHLFASLPRVQIGLAVVVHMLLGLLSMIAWLTLWSETTRSDRVFGFILQMLLPSQAILWVARRNRRAEAIVGDR